jgi:hypothetical protein
LSLVKIIKVLSKRFNSFGQVNYVTIAEDGTETFNDFVLSIESGVDVVKPSIIQPAADAERPKAYRLSSSQIGNVVEDREDGGYATILRRMNGDYNPIFNNIITFSDINSGYIFSTSCAMNPKCFLFLISFLNVNIFGSKFKILLPSSIDISFIFFFNFSSDGLIIEPSTIKSLGIKTFLV